MKNWPLFLCIIVVCIAIYAYINRAKKTTYTGTSDETAPPVHEPKPTAIADLPPQKSSDSPPPEPGTQAKSITEIAFIDLETTGLDPSTDRVIEVGVLTYKKGENKASGYSCLANPGTSIPSRITELTGITNEMVADKPMTGAVIAEFLDAIGDKPVLAYNAKFDVGFLKAEAARIGRSFDNHSVCIMELAKEKHPGLRRYRLQDMCEVLSIQVEPIYQQGPHRAAFDAQRAAHLYFALCAGKQPSQEKQDEGPPRWFDRSQLAAYHATRDSAKFVFQQGKASEKSDMASAARDHKTALNLFMKAATIQIYQLANESVSLPRTSQTGDIECLNRLTLCLCKLGHAQQAHDEASAYFQICTEDVSTKTADIIRKRIEKALTKAVKP